MVWGSFFGSNSSSREVSFPEKGSEAYEKAEEEFFKQLDWYGVANARTYYERGSPLEINQNGVAFVELTSDNAVAYMPIAIHDGVSWEFVDESLKKGR